MRDENEKNIRETLHSRSGSAGSGLWKVWRTFQRRGQPPILSSVILGPTIVKTAPLVVMRVKSRNSIGRIIFAVVAGYLANAILVLATEELLSWLGPGAGAPPLGYVVIDLLSQCIYTMVGGYLCRVMARSSQRVALAGLIGLGVLVGTASLITSWKNEPHWYGVALLAVYPPCVWIGWTLKGRVIGKYSSS